MKVVVSEQRVITGININLSTEEVPPFLNLLEMARRQIAPMCTERLNTCTPYVRDMSVRDFDSMQQMMHNLFDSFPEEDLTGG